MDIHTFAASKKDELVAIEAKYAEKLRSYNNGLALNTFLESNSKVTFEGWQGD